MIRINLRTLMILFTTLSMFGVNPWRHAMRLIDTSMLSKVMSTGSLVRTTGRISPRKTPFLNPKSEERLTEPRLAV